MRQWIFRLGVLVVVTAFVVPVANAQGEPQDIGYQGAGFRVGLNTFPNQFQFGGQLNLGEFVPNFRFQPSATVGIGDDRVIYMFNVDAAYYVPLDNEANWEPYVGAGLGIGIEDSDLVDGVDVRAGLNLFGGVEWGARYRYFFEGRTQIGTSLGDFTVLFGMNF